jgi:hypothetical protein
MLSDFESPLFGGAPRVCIKDSKDGCTALLVVAMCGLIGVQLIFGGATAAVHPKKKYPLIQYIHNDSHWLNDETSLFLWEDNRLQTAWRHRRELRRKRSLHTIMRTHKDAFPTTVPQNKSNERSRHQAVRK